MSFASALIGEMYTQCTFFWSLPSNAFRTNSSITVRNAVRVFPEPVGEHNNKCLFSIIAGIANFCGLVKSGNLSLNQFLTGGQSIASNLSVSDGLSRYSIFTILFHNPSGSQ